MILINVLVIVMLATAILAVILASGQDDVERTIALRSAAQAMATARGGELSAIAALRRDQARGGETDTLADEWATIGDRDAAIPGGRFSFVVSDAQAKFNVNNLARGDVVSRDAFAAIGRAAGLSPDAIVQVEAMLALGGAIGDLSDLQVAGLSDAQLRRLAAFCTVLPSSTDINANTASEPLLAILFGDPATARSFVSLRGRGGLTSGQLPAAGVLMPPGVGLRSDYYWARSRVVMGGTRQQLTSLLQRRIVAARLAAVAIRRWKGAAPIDAPPLP